MYEVLPEVKEWLRHDEEVVLATVISTWGSSPRGLGAKMAFTPSGKIAGSVSGGCVEGEVFDSGISTLKNKQPVLLSFGVSDDTAFNLGLTCGGRIEVFVKPLDPDFFAKVSQELEALHPIAIVTAICGIDSLIGKEILIVDGGGVYGQLGNGLDEEAIAQANQALVDAESQIVTIKKAEGEDVRLFIDVISSPPTLVMVGGVHIAIALASLAKTLGFRTVVVDPRRSFGNLERFPSVDQVFQSWPQEAFCEIKLRRDTCVVMLTHDPKIDDPALEIVLRSSVFYIGALGSKKTNERRIRRLKEVGISPTLLERLHAPVGLNIGAKTPEEIALSILAEIIAVRRGRIK